MLALTTSTYLVPEVILSSHDRDRNSPLLHYSGCHNIFPMYLTIYIQNYAMIGIDEGILDAVDLKDRFGRPERGE
jgi:hypothetical protein